jgi:selenocysteine lyase/cysteine desulfurase
LRARLAAGYAVIRQHENKLSRAFLQGIRGAKGLRLIGIDDEEKVDRRTSTFALVADAFHTVQDFNRRLLQEGLVAGASNFYAKCVKWDECRNGRLAITASIPMECRNVQG